MAHGVLEIVALCLYIGESLFGVEKVGSNTYGLAFCVMTDILEEGELHYLWVAATAMLVKIVLLASRFPGYVEIKIGEYWFASHVL
jgi:hypothetical protein